MDQDMVSFVLRFVREAGEEQQARWRGVIKHVQSNTETSFSQFSEALAFMQSYVNDIAQASFAETSRLGQNMAEANPFMETARLWGDFMPRYTKMMMDSMGEAMSGGVDMTRPMQEMMDSALSAWGLPTWGDSAQREKPAGQEGPAAALEAMTAQMAALNEKIANLDNQLSQLRQQKDETE